MTIALGYARTFDWNMTSSLGYATLGRRHHSLTDASSMARASARAAMAALLSGKVGAFISPASGVTWRAAAGLRISHQQPVTRCFSMAADVDKVGFIGTFSWHAGGMLCTTPFIPHTVCASPIRLLVGCIHLLPTYVPLGIPSTRNLPSFASFGSLSQDSCMHALSSPSLYVSRDKPSYSSS